VKKQQWQHWSEWDQHCWPNSTSVAHCYEEKTQNLPWTNPRKY